MKNVTQSVQCDSYPPSSLCINIKSHISTHTQQHSIHRCKWSSLSFHKYHLHSENVLSDLMEAKMANIARNSSHLFVCLLSLPCGYVGIHFHHRYRQERKKCEKQMERGKNQMDTQHNNNRETFMCWNSFWVFFYYYLVAQSDYGLLSTITAIVLLHH